MTRMHDALAIDRIRVAHWPGNPAALSAGNAGPAFVVDTCLRRLLVTAGNDAARDPRVLDAPEVYAGAAAYRFLLEVTTGLQSAVPGETNVFGQFKRAWEYHRRAAPRSAVESLAPLIAQLIRDTRAIRRRHLQNIGGASYGPLVRRLLRADADDRILIVGAGELARSILPFFSSFPVGVWNRRAPGAALAAAGRVFAPADGMLAADWAHHVIMTTPADAQNDGRWSAWLGASLVQTVVHLGHRRGDGVPWPAHAAGYDLDDVFELRRSQDKIRSLQLQRARHDCHELARCFAVAIGPPAPRLAAG